MSKKQVKFFLRQRPGYLKEGKKRLQRVLLRKGYAVSLEDCAEALKEMRYNQVPQPISKEDNDLKVLIYDIETSYNIVKSWRIGYNLNINPQDIIHERAIICVSYKWLGESTVTNITWDKNQDDKKLLNEFIKVLNQADLLVAHNGDRYDLKFIKTRALKHDLPMLVNYPQFDTLKVAKKKFSFNSNKLDYIAEFLGFGNKIKTDLSLWDEIIMNKSQSAMDEMIRYCNMDVELLEKVYKKLTSWELPKVHAGVIINDDRVTSPFTGSKNIELLKTTSTPRGTIKRIMVCNDTENTFELSDSQYRKLLKEEAN